MPAGTASLYYHKVGQAVSMPLPGPADHPGSPSAGDDGGQQHLAVPGNLGQFGGKPRSGDNGVGAAFNGSPDIVRIVLYCHHHIHAHQTAAFGDLLGFGDLFLQAAAVDIQGGAIEIRVTVAGMGSGDHTHAAAGSHCACQAGQGNTHAHTALDNGDRKFSVTNFHIQSQSFARSFLS